MSVVGDKQGKVTSVLDEQLQKWAEPLRMCSGCADFKDHAQHHVSSVPVAALLHLLEASGHKPKFVAIE